MRPDSQKKLFDIGYLVGLNWQNLKCVSKFFEEFGTQAFTMRMRSEIMRDFGPSMSPQNAFYILQGLETLPIRMNKHIENTREVVSFLTECEEIEWINYPSLKSHKDYNLSKKILPKGAGAIFSFGIRGGKTAGKKLIENVHLASHLANVGDVRSLVKHPASTTHQQLSDEDLASGGVTADMVRLSVGLEDVDDILWDLDQALMKAAS